MPCKSCGQPYKGFGDTCGSCRKLTQRAATSRACFGCNSYFWGNGTLCEDCQKSAGESRTAAKAASATATAAGGAVREAAAGAAAPAGGAHGPPRPARPEPAAARPAEAPPRGTVQAAADEAKQHSKKHQKWMLQLLREKGGSVKYGVLVEEGEKHACDTVGAMLKILKTRKIIGFQQPFLMYPRHENEVITLLDADVDLDNL